MAATNTGNPEPDNGIDAVHETPKQRRARKRKNLPAVKGRLRLGSFIEIPFGDTFCTFGPINGRDCIIPDWKRHEIYTDGALRNLVNQWDEQLANAICVAWSPKYQKWIVVKGGRRLLAFLQKNSGNTAEYLPIPAIILPHECDDDIPGYVRRMATETRATSPLSMFKADLAANKTPELDVTAALRSHGILPCWQYRIPRSYWYTHTAALPVLRSWYMRLSPARFFNVLKLITVYELAPGTFEREALTSEFLGGLFHLAECGMYTLVEIRKALTAARTKAAVTAASILADAKVTKGHPQDMRIVHIYQLLKHETAIRTP